MPVRVLRYKTLESEPLLVDDKSPLKKAKNDKTPKKVCICGKCSCRKHHCPVHHLSKVNPAPEDSHSLGMSAVTNYQETFNKLPHLTARRGMKVPLTVSQFDIKLPKKLGVETEHGASYKPTQLPSKTKGFKPSEEYVESSVPLAGDTSYKVEFKQPGTLSLPRPQWGRHLQSLVQFGDSGLSHYNTTSKDHFQRWMMQPHQKHRGEMAGMSLFHGSIDCDTTSKNSFNESAIVGGRPSTNYKQDEVSFTSNAPFVADTTTKADFQAQNGGIRKNHILSKKRSTKSKESMTWPSKVHHASTQYSSDTKLVLLQGPQHREGIIVPVPDTLNIFRGNPGDVPPDIMNSITNSTYVKSWADQPKPRSSYKIKEVDHTNTAPFEGFSCTKNHFKPISPESQKRITNEVDKKAALLSFTQQEGIAVKRANRFAGTFYADTTSKDHFKPWQTKARTRVGDPLDGSFVPSLNSFNTESMYRSAYVPLKAKPSETCKPLEERFRNEEGARASFEGATSYGQDFQRVDLPRANHCPAHALLYDS